MKYSYSDWRMCGRKKNFPTQSSANKAARRISEQSNYRLNFRSYECPLCNCWHITKLTAPPQGNMMNKGPNSPRAVVDVHPSMPDVHRVVISHKEVWEVVETGNQAHCESIAKFLNKWPELIIRALAIP